MRKFFFIEKNKSFIEKIPQFVDSNFMLLNSNEAGASYLALGKLDEIPVSEDAFEALKKIAETKKDWLFGYFGYDLKNQTENLTSNNFDGLHFPDFHFFQPRYVIEITEGGWKVWWHTHYNTEEDARETVKQFLNTKPTENRNETLKLNSRISKNEYLESVRKIKQHIQLGDIYEANFCQEFYAENSTIDPGKTYQKLNAVSPAPFSCYYQNDGHYLLCASPERFLKKEGNKIISQPIKGTIKRGETESEDEQLKQQLLNSQKDKSENVMIVDLVRNDLSRTAAKDSIKVDELFGIYTFPQVHQMISTISSELKENTHFVDAIKNAFPMGSMTGAPKIKAMELIEKYESTKRGLFSGAVGYISPAGNFDFNVVIRSIQYNSTNKYLSVMAGGAITANSNEEEEYHECLLKAKAMFEVLGCNPPE